MKDQQVPAPATVADIRTPDPRRLVVFGLLAAAIVAANAVIVSLYPAWQEHAAPEWPIAIDLLLVLPFAYLALNSRSGRAAVWRAAGMCGLGVLLGSLIVPTESKQLWLVLEPLRYVVLGGIVLAQLCVVAAVAATIVVGRHVEHPEQALDRSVDAWIGDRGLARIVRLEARVWLYALLRHPGRRPYSGQRHFHVGAQGMNASNQLGFLVLLGAEIPMAHLLIALFDPLIAAVVSALSIYGFLFLLADYRASVHRPISADANGLHLRYGVATDCRVPWENVVGASRFNGSVRRTRGQMRLIGMGQANVVIDLAPGTRLAGLFGERETRRIHLGVDDPTAFVEEVASRIG